MHMQSHAGALEWVKDVHCHVLEAGLEEDVLVGNALVHMNAKSRSIDDALQLVFDKMKDYDSIMIGELADHGCGHEAYELFLPNAKRGLYTESCM